jgi:hypothetical protein
MHHNPNGVIEMSATNVKNRKFVEFLPLIRHYTAIHDVVCDAVLTKDGGDWIEVGGRGQIDSKTSTHAIRFSDGRVFDLVNGFRPKYPPRGRLERPLIQEYCVKNGVKVTHVKFEATWTFPLGCWRIVNNEKDMPRAVAFRFSNGITWDPVDGFCDNDDFVTDELLRILGALGLADVVEEKPAVKEPKQFCVYSNQSIVAVRLYADFMFHVESMVPVWLAQLITSRMVRPYGLNKVIVEIPNMKKCISSGGDYWIVRDRSTGNLTVETESAIEILRNGD